MNVLALITRGLLCRPSSGGSGDPVVVDGPISVKIIDQAVNVSIVQEQIEVRMREHGEIVVCQPHDELTVTIDLE